MSEPPVDRYHVQIGGGVAGQVVTGAHNTVSWQGPPPPAAGPAAGPEVGVPGAGGAAVHRCVVALDVAGSGSRDDQILLRLRAELRAMTARALSDVDADDADVDDLGDGLRLVTGPDVAPATLLGPFVRRLDSLLREYAKVSAPAAEMRLRVVVHMGLLHRDNGIWAGHPLVLAARLLDADPARRALVDTPAARLVVVVSQAVYEAVIAHGYGLDPGRYRPIPVRVKETDTVAWIHLPGAGA